MGVHDEERRALEPPDDGFAWASEPEPDWVEGIRDARRRRANRLAEALADPYGTPVPRPKAGSEESDPNPKKAPGRDGEGSGS